MKLLKYSILPVFFLIITLSCAKIGTPVGGPKDVTPPEVDWTKTKPANNSTNFSGKKVEITFNEFLKLKDIQKLFVTSPPFKNKPEVILKYKTVVVNFKDSLIPNATYTLNFGNSITDNNEGNAIRAFEFVFSTGDFIDSLSYEGKVTNALDHKPDKEGLFVMLYDVMGDSVPFKYLPAYTAKTNEMGFFRINHIKADTFMVVAVKDNNNNFMMDTNEEVAFSDSLLYLNSSFYHAPDTAAAKDTARSDSAYFSRFKPQIELYYFKEDNKSQYLVKKERKLANQLFYNFNAPLTDTFKISIADNPVKKPWYLLEESANRDSMTVWITDTTLIKTDTLKTVLVYPMLDSTNTLQPKFDTLRMVYKAPQAEQRRSKKLANKEIQKLSISSNARDGFDLNNKIVVIADQPIDSIDKTKIYFTYLEDTVSTPVKYTVNKDSADFRKFRINFTPSSGTAYTLVFDSLAVSSIYNTYNDSLGVKFNAQRDDFYGAIKAKLEDVKGNVILQVMDDKEALIKTYFLKEDKLVTIDYLAPGKYMLKVIFDTNDNRKWTPGNYLKKIQPEKVEYFKDIITVRSNWDVEVTWKLGQKEVAVGSSK